MGSSSSRSVRVYGSGPARGGTGSGRTAGVVTAAARSSEAGHAGIGRCAMVGARPVISSPAPCPAHVARVGPVPQTSYGKIEKGGTWLLISMAKPVNLLTRVLSNPTRIFHRAGFSRHFNGLGSRRHASACRAGPDATASRPEAPLRPVGTQGARGRTGWHGGGTGGTEESRPARRSAP